MTAVPDIKTFLSARPAGEKTSHARPYQLDEAYWGYVIRNSRRASLGLMIAQGASLAVGVAFAIMAIGIWAFASDSAAHGLFLFKLVASVPTAAAAVLLVWFASRGTLIDIQVDTNQGELREVLRNRAGRSTLIGVYGFDAMAGVVLQRDAHEQKPGGHAKLVLRYRNSGRVLPIAQGPEAMLQLLRDRLGHDLMLSRGEQRQRTFEPTLERSKAA